MQNKDVINVITQGRAYKSSSFLLKMAVNKDKLRKSVSILSPKKQFPTAVLRNKARRRMKALINYIVSNQNTPLNKDYLYVFTLNKSILVEDFSKCRTEIEQFVAKNDILRY